MEPWREEIHNDYLMHYGIKNMRWGFNKGKKNGKKTKMSDLERQARTAESLQRASDDRWKEVEHLKSKGMRDFNTSVRLMNGISRSYDQRYKAEMNGASYLGDIEKRIKRLESTKKKIDRTREKDDRRLDQIYEPSRKLSIAAYDAMNKAKQMAEDGRYNKEAKKNYKRHKAKQKVKEFISNLFKKR